MSASNLEPLILHSDMISIGEIWQMNGKYYLVIGETISNKTRLLRVNYNNNERNLFKIIRPQEIIDVDASVEPRPYTVIIESNAQYGGFRRMSGRMSRRRSGRMSRRRFGKKSRRKTYSNKRK